MERSAVERVAELMTAMAAGDASAMFTLYTEFGAVIRRVLQSHFADRGVHVVPADEMNGLTLDATMALFEAAPSWRADGGAMPWTWAERRLRAIVNAYLGPHTREFGDEDGGVVATDVAAADVDELDHLETVARDDDTIRLLVDALDATSSRRDAQVFLSVRAQAAGGDPSPANTVAARHGMKPPAVRQAAKRVGDRLRALAARDATYAPLLELPLLER
ncbi:MAG TPA: hypothetical protein VHC63_17150 [Acidimicrobiales bacterium]|nr:hypothetical protein [Acidimicrobiales bacterium]